ncbi:MAG: C-GCAxxG-C-C family protein [Ignavibacteriaceae bacterium]
MANKNETASEKFSSGYNCAQAVLYSFKDNINIEGNAALKMACGFGAGMGRKGEVCGAVTGGIMVIGAKYGRGANDEKTATEKTYTKTRELMDKFETRHGAIICRELLNGCDLSTEEGQMQFRNNDLFNITCKKCVVNVVQILEDIL